MSTDADKINILTNYYRAYICPLTSVLGMIGNCFILITFAFNINNKFVIYCFSLAIYNFMALLTNTFMDDFLDRGLRHWTNNTYHISIENISNSWCLFMEYVPNVMYFSSCYIMVAFTLDRMLVIIMPIKYSPFRYYKLTIIICVMIGVSGCIVASPLLYGYAFNETTLNCQIINQFAGNIGLYLKSIVIFVIPTILVAIFNIVIYTSLLRIKKRRKQLKENYSGCTSSSVKSKQSKSTTMSMNSSYNGSVTNRDSKNEMGRIVTHLALSTVFLLLTIPLSISIILRLIVTQNPNQIHTNYSQIIIQLTKLFSSIKDLGYAVNFLLYIIFIPSFKYDFYRVFRRCCNKLSFNNNYHNHQHNNFRRCHFGNDDKISCKLKPLAFNTDYEMNLGPSNNKNSLSIVKDAKTVS